MLTLAINTASSKTGIALLDNAQLIAENSWQSANDEAEKLMPAIKELLHGRPFNEIKKVIVVNGPGSFTGLRVGVTVANTIAYLNQCDLQAINSFEYWWSALQKTDKETALLIYAGRGGVYVSHYGENSGHLVNMPDLNAYLAEHNISKIFGDISPEQKEGINKEGINSIEFIKVGQKFGQIIETMEPEKFTSTRIVKPLYVKAPAITKSKKSIF